MKLSVIIPTLNEEIVLPKLLDQITSDQNEVMVVDGGSTDGTVSVAEKFGVRLLQSRPGRAVQMNVGAAAAAGDLLWFLHADSQLPSDWRNQLTQTMANSDVIGGGFHVKIDASRFRYRFLDAWGGLRTRLQRSFYGDQGIFVRRQLFDKLGGFTHLPILEDLDFSTRMSRLGKVAILPGPLRTSARRWEREGWWRTVLMHSRLAISYTVRPTDYFPMAVVIIAKAPIPGRVKTRLVPPLTPEQAAGLAEKLLQETVTLVCGLKGVTPVIAVDPPEAAEEIQSSINHPIRTVTQTEGDLGNRFRQLFERLLREGIRGVILLGADHPNLPADYLQRAVTILKQGKDQVVLGPTEDGGYYLIGLTRLHSQLFQGVPWSSSRVLETTCERARVIGLPVSLLPSWYDVDRPEDLARLPKSWGLPVHPELR